MLISLLAWRCSFMKVFLLYGDMRGAISKYAAEQMADWLRGRGISVEMASLSQFELPCCTMCGRCLDSGEEHCEHSAQVRSIERRMMECGALIIVAPVFREQVTAQVMSLFEHLAYHRGRPVYFGRPAIAAAISDYGSPLPRRAAQMMCEALTDWGYSNVRKILFRFGDPFIVRSETEADRLADRLLSPIKESPSLVRVFRFNLRRAFISLGSASSPDSLYWKTAGLIKRTIPPGDANSKVKSMFGNLVFRFFNAVFFRR